MQSDQQRERSNVCEDTGLVSQGDDSSIASASEEGIMNLSQENSVVCDGYDDDSTIASEACSSSSEDSTVNMEKVNVCASEELQSKDIEKAENPKKDLRCDVPENIVTEKDKLQLLSLPCDAMHFIASFLSPSDWKSMSCVSVGANRACRAVFRRVRLHGFRCAAEVVSALVRGEHSDARELIALYVKHGVPIYPPCLGHTYNTLIWRLSVEAKELERSMESPEQSPLEKLDRFYTLRLESRDQGGYFLPSLTYLEEKCLFWGHQLEESSSSNVRRYPDESSPRRHNPVLQMLPGQVRNQTSQRRQILHSLRRGHPNQKAKVIVQIHRHLANQHFQGYPIASDDDSAGNIPAGPISLSSDFFHSINEPNATPSNVSMTHSNSMTQSNLAGIPFMVEGPENRNPVHSRFPYSAVSSFLPQSNDTLLTDFVLQIYSGSEQSSLKPRFDNYQRKLGDLLDSVDSNGYNECLLDFWDEFLPKTAGIHYFDKHTPVPRISMMHSFLTKPCPRAIGTVQCEIERFKRSPTSKRQSVKGRLFPTYEYRLFIRDRRSTDNSSLTRKDTLLMTAKNKGRHFQGANAKRGVNNYCLYMATPEDVELHQQSHKKDDAKKQNETSEPLVLGRLQSNFIGTEFQIFSPIHKPFSLDDENSEYANCYNEVSDSNDTPKADKNSKRRSKTGSWPSLPSRPSRRGIAPSDDTSLQENNNTSPSPFLEEEDGAITYTANILGNRPRVMDVCIPKLNEDGSECEWRQCLSNNDGSSKMLSLFKQLQERDEGESFPDYGLVALQNRPPWWNFELGAFVLNFGGRVSVASVKNFQLCDRDDPENVMLQFGRIQGRHSFTMDFTYPLTAMQAFAIAISSLQSKISLG